MSVARRKGAAGRSDILFSRIVRSRGECARCGLHASGDTCLFETAHIVRRGYRTTRCLEQNAWCLCPSCHRVTGDDPAEFMELVDRTITRPVYEGLRLMANQGTDLSSVAFWRGELVRLMARCEELGIDSRTAARYPWAA